MTKNQILSSIKKSSALLDDIGLLNSFVNAHTLDVNDAFMKISFNHESKYEEIYLTGLEQQNYNFILNDYSYFQFSFREQEDRRNGWTKPYARYAFYPNPFEQNEGGLEEIYRMYKDEEIDFEEYSQAISEYKPLLKRLPVRYDLSFRQFEKVYHPTSHFHFTLSENSRLASNKVFSPLVFTMMIMNTYYLDEWMAHSQSKGSFYLESMFKREISLCENISDYNTKDNEYFCSLQNELICLR